MLAFEIAQQLRTLGCEVELLAILDTRLTPAKRSLKGRANLALRFFTNLPFRLATVMFSDRPDQLLLRSKDRVRRLLRGILSRLRNDGEMKTLSDVVDTDRISPEERGRWQRDHEALQNYRPLPYDGQLLLVRAHTRSLFRGLDHDLGWSPLVKKRLDVRVVPGHHANMLDEAHIGDLASFLATELAGHPGIGN
jgi:thioesterase domain-containing protein